MVSDMKINNSMSIDNPIKAIKIVVVLCVIALTAVASVAADGLPDVPKALEIRLYQGKPEKIEAFIKVQETLVSNIVSQAEKDLSQAKNPNDKNAISNALATFQGLSFQFHRLLSELNLSRDLSVKPPVLGEPPYSYEIFKKVRTFQKKINQQLKDNAKEIDLLKQKSSTIESNLKSMVFVYAGMKKDDAPGKFLAYGKLADIYSLQTEYARLSLKMSRLNIYSGTLHDLQAKSILLVTECLKKIHISDEDIKNALNDLQNAKKKEKSFLQKLQQDTKSLNGRSIRYELQLENIVEKAGNETQNSVINFLQIEKQRIMIIIETIRIKLRGMNQKKINLEINSLNALFRYKWLEQYAGYEGAEKKLSLIEVINTWKARRDSLQQIKVSINSLLSWTNIEQSRLTKELVLAFNEKETVSDQKIKFALSALARQILKAKQLSDNLIVTAADTNNDINNLSDDIDWFLESLGHEMPWYMNIKVYFEKNISNDWTKVRSLFFYPLFSAGTINITLTLIFKFIFLLIAGFYFLRLIRRKSTALLRDKTKLSIGTINSITTLGYYVLLVLVCLIILTSVGVDLSQITVLVGALGVGIGFGLQTIANNFISGIILLTEQSVKIGDIIKLENGLTCQVERIAIRATIVKTVDGNEVIVPNSELVSGRVNSWTYSDNWRRLKIPFGVSYDSDPDEIVKIAKEAAREVSGTIDNIMHPINVRFIGFGDNSLDFTLRVWRRMDTLRGDQGLLSDYYFVLFRKLKQEGIEIPFPQNVLHLQSVSSEVMEAVKTHFPSNTSENTER